MVFTLITGGNSGVGRECARHLALKKTNVIIASRDTVASEAAASEIRAEAPEVDIEVMRLDLGSMADVRRFVGELRSKEFTINAIVCNAGLMKTHLTTTCDNLETTFAVNHLGHFLLVNLLLHHLMASSPSRVIVVSSATHDPMQMTGMPNPDVESMETLATTGCASPDPAAYNGRLAYVNSKLANLWFTYELIRRIEAKRLLGITVHAYEPGLVPGSGLARDYPAWARQIWNVTGPAFGWIASKLTYKIGTSSRAGAALAALVQDPALSLHSGLYFPSHTGWREGPSSEESYQPQPAAQLWNTSMELTQLTRTESPLV